MHYFSSVISKFKRKRILVIGDIILDRYIQGSVSRISPEAPVPVVVEERCFHTIGGAANVAHNLSSLDSKVIQVGRIGADTDGRTLIQDLKEKGIETTGVFVDKNIPTVTKTRIIAQHQQVVRVDREDCRACADPKINDKIINFIQKKIDSVDAIIISDYGKGMITSNLVSFICSLAIQKGKIITVDPKIEHFNYYKNVTAITPNKKELENAVTDLNFQSDGTEILNIKPNKLKTTEDIDIAAKQILRLLEPDALLVTLGEDGMRLFEKGRKPFSIKTQAREVYDVSGAGDTVIAVFTLALTTGADKKDAARLANLAAGIVVGKIGAVAIGKNELLRAIKEM